MALLLLAFVACFSAVWDPWVSLCQRTLSRLALFLRYWGVNYLQTMVDVHSPWLAFLCFVGMGFAFKHLVKHARKYQVSAAAYLRARRALGDALPLAPTLISASDVRIVPSDGENGICLELRVDGHAVRVSLTPDQAVAAVASSIPQNQSRGKEMAIPGKTPRPVEKMPPGIVSLRVGASVFGMGCRVSFNHKTYLMTATHVIDNAKGFNLLIESNGKCLPLDDNIRVAFRSKAADFDMVLLDVPSPMWSVLAVKALEIGAVNTFVARSACVYGYSKLGKPQVDYGDAVACKERLFTLKHMCYTQPSYSGSPLLSSGKVIGVHTGATPSGAAANVATSLALLLAFQRKETPYAEGAWSELSQDEYDRIEQQNEHAKELEAQYDIEYQFDEDDTASTTHLRSRGNEYTRDDVSLAARGVTAWADYDEDNDEDIPEPLWKESASEQERMSTPRASVAPVVNVAPALPAPLVVSRVAPILNLSPAQLLQLVPPAPRAKPLPPTPSRSKESGYVRLADLASLPDNLSREARMRPMVEALKEPAPPRPPPPPKPSKKALAELALLVPPSALKRAIKENEEHLNLQGPASEVGGSQTSKSSVTSVIIFGSTTAPLVRALALGSPSSVNAPAASQEAAGKRKRHRRPKPKN